MAHSLIPTPEKLNMKGDLVSNWEYFKDSWNNYATATELSKNIGRNRRCDVVVCHGQGMPSDLQKPPSLN